MADFLLMVSSRYYISRPNGPALAGAVETPIAEFALTALALTVGVVGLAALLSAGGAGSIALSLAAFALAATIAGRAQARTYPHAHIGLCNVVTLTRLALTTSMLAPLVAGTSSAWAVFAVALTALALDGIDGWLARRAGYVSEFGARFDVEVDSLFALLLALSAATVSGLGVIVVLLGLPRYLFVAASWGLPWMRRDLPERFSRKVVCVIQLGTLIALQVPILSAPVVSLLVTLVALSLLWSFATDLAWLWRRRA